MVRTTATMTETRVAAKTQKTTDRPQQAAGSNGFEPDRAASVPASSFRSRRKTGEYAVLETFDDVAGGIFIIFENTQILKLNKK